MCLVKILTSVSHSDALKDSLVCFVKTCCCAFIVYLFVEGAEEMAMDKKRQDMIY